MFRDRITMSILAASLVVTPVSRAAADAGDALVGGIVGGLIGGAIVNESNKKKQVRQKTYVKRTYVNSATRAQNREVQTSLNYFGFPAGTPDGVLGRNSRYAVSQYQAFMGYPASGYLSPYERDFLVGSYHRAISGGYATTQLIAGNPMGPKGLLKTYQQERAGGPASVPVVAPVAPVAVAPVAVAPVQVAPVAVQPAAPATTVVVQPQATPGTQTTTTTTVTAAPQAADSGSALPNFMGQGGGLSLASHCNKVSLLTSTNGGFTTEASMADPNLALNEQFCLARTYAIAQGEDLISKVQGFTPDQIAQQCEGFGPAMKEYVAALSLKPEAEVLQGVSGFVLNSGMAPAQLVGTAKICLSVGYRTDDMDVALGSALLLTALGEKVYAELPGHHLSQGIGASKRADLALAWYDTSLTALDQGAVPVFAPGQPERQGLIRKAAFQIGGKSDGAAVAAPTTAPVPAALPSFGIKN